MYSIYKYTFPNGKIYIGKTKTSIEVRAGSNGVRYGTNTLVGRAIYKYGWDNVKKEILYSGLSKEDANKLEIITIANLNTTNRTVGYNLTRGGDGGATLGHEVSEDTRKKIGEKNSIALRGRKRDKASVEKSRQAMLGHVVTEETREKIRIANVGKRHTEETKLKISTNNKSHLPEVRQKISDSLKQSGKERAEKRMATLHERYPDGWTQTIESNKKRSDAMKGKSKSEETKQKMRKPKSPEAVENMRRAQRLRREAEKLGLSYQEYLTRIGGSGK